MAKDGYEDEYAGPRGYTQRLQSHGQDIARSGLFYQEHDWNEALGVRSQRSSYALANGSVQFHQGPKDIKDRCHGNRRFVHPTSSNPSTKSLSQQRGKSRFTNPNPKPGVVPPSPACARALSTVTAALSSSGHTIIPITPPSPSNALLIASSLLSADGCLTFLAPFRTFERNDPGASVLSLFASLPLPFRYIHYLWTKYIRKDPFWADLTYGIRERTVREQWEIVAQREAYKESWHEWWQDQETEDGRKLDVILTVPNATPAMPHGGMRDALASCGYTFLFNLVSPPLSQQQHQPNNPPKKSSIH